MTVNKFKLTLNPNNSNPMADRYLNIPIELKWDLSGQDDSIDEIQQNVVEQVIGKPTDYECSRFANNFYPNTTKTDINYNFYFFSGTTSLLNNPNDWALSYAPQQFSDNETYYNVRPFTKSFFKLDLYDSDNSTKQINYLTLIIPTTNSLTTPVFRLFQNNSTKPIKLPKFKMDYLGYKENFFIYWLKNTDYLDIQTFYMSAKFFNAKTGEFVKMMNQPQSSVSTLYNFKPETYYYYKVKLNYTNFTYEIFDYTSTQNEIRVGSTSNPIKWYQYINPQ